MSHLGNIIGISDLEVERVNRDKGIEVYAKPTKRPNDQRAFIVRASAS